MDIDMDRINKNFANSIRAVIDLNNYSNIYDKRSMSLDSLNWFGRDTFPYKQSSQLQKHQL